MAKTRFGPWLFSWGSEIVHMLRLQRPKPNQQRPKDQKNSLFISHLILIYFLFAPEAAPKKRMKSLSGDKTSEVPLPKAFS